MEEAAPPAAPRPLLSNGRGTPSVGRKAVATAAGATCDKTSARSFWLISGRGSGSRDFCLTIAEVSTYDLLRTTLRFHLFPSFTLQSFIAFILDENSESVSCP